MFRFLLGLCLIVLFIDNLKYSFCGQKRVTSKNRVEERTLAEHCSIKRCFKVTPKALSNVFPRFLHIRKNFFSSRLFYQFRPSNSLSRDVTRIFQRGKGGGGGGGGHAVSHPGYLRCLLKYYPTKGGGESRAPQDPPLPTPLDHGR